MAELHQEGQSFVPDIRVLVADDHQLFREGIRHIFEAIGGCTVVGEAQNGLEAVELARKLTPDIVLMDINMPVLNGVEATLRVAEEAPVIQVIILTMYRDEDHAFDAIKAGARGYLYKDMDGQELVDAVKAVHRGEGIMTPEMAGRLLNEFRRVSLEARKTASGETLSRGEMAVLKLVAQGQDNRLIADHLDISLRTVAHRLSCIFEKLRVNNRTQAALMALRKGWADLDPEP